MVTLAPKADFDDTELATTREPDSRQTGCVVMPNEPEPYEQQWNDDGRDCSDPFHVARATPTTLALQRIDEG
jgi:hypothetical protein